MSKSKHMRTGPRNLGGGGAYMCVPNERASGGHPQGKF